MKSIICNSRNTSLKTDSETDLVFSEESDNQSVRSSLFSFDGLSAYNPSCDSEDYTDTEESSNEGNDHDLVLDKNKPDPLIKITDNELEYICENNESNENNGYFVDVDPNIWFVVDAVHEHYENAQGLWRDTNNAP